MKNSELLRRFLCHSALVTSSGILVNESLAGSAIEELDGHNRVFATRSSMTLLEGGAKRGALGAVARHGGPGLTHVLLRGRDIRHLSDLQALGAYPVISSQLSL